MELVKKNGYFVHPTAFIDEPCNIGKGTKIWCFSHIMKDAKIGKDCKIGQNVVIHPTAIIGNNVKIQNNVSVYDAVILEDNVFCGPSMVFTNIINPRSEYPRNDPKFYKKTRVKEGATIGTNATIVCGNTLGRYAFIGAGSVVTQDIPDYALVYGNPTRLKGWMCECGNKLKFIKNKAVCKDCKKEFKQSKDVVRRIK